MDFVLKIYDDILNIFLIKFILNGRIDIRKPVIINKINNLPRFYNLALLLHCCIYLISVDIDLPIIFLILMYLIFYIKMYLKSENIIYFHFTNLLSGFYLFKCNVYEYSFVFLLLVFCFVYGHREGVRYRE